MAFLNYEYKMKIRYSEPVNRCHFTIKSVPTDDFRQRSIAYDISISPSTHYSECKDSFGNIQIIGREVEEHSEFIFNIKGLVETLSDSVVGGVNLSTVGMFKYPHGKCIPGDTISEFAKKVEMKIEDGMSDREKCLLVMNQLYERMSYVRGSTTLETTAEEAFSNGKGVCQDYSHIFITLLRLFKIPARYVSGLIVGEGESHAWVEAACNGIFVAFDPTHNIELNDEYIKLGMGRDASDCAINRGVMWGGGLQIQQINVTVDKYY